VQPTGSRCRRNWWCRGQRIETGTRDEKERKPPGEKEETLR
jgi:hypothetical protein